MPIIGLIALLLFAWLAGEHGRPKQFALAFTAVALVLAAIGNEFSPFDAAVTAVMNFVYCSVYFWALDRFGDNIIVYFVILFGGAVIWAGWPMLVAGLP